MEGKSNFNCHISRKKKNQTIPHILFCLKSFSLPIDAFKSARTSTVRELHFFEGLPVFATSEKNKRVSIREEKLLPSFDGKRNTLKNLTEKYHQPKNQIFANEHTHTHTHSTIAVPSPIRLQRGRGQ